MLELVASYELEELDSYISIIQEKEIWENETQNN